MVLLLITCAPAISMISIIIPAHNEFDNLQRLFKIACFLEHEKLLEILVAVSAGNSDTIDKLECSSKVKIIRCKNKGRAAQMNEAAAIAKGLNISHNIYDIQLTADSFETYAKKIIEDIHELVLIVDKLENEEYP